MYIPTDRQTHKQTKHPDNQRFKDNEGIDHSLALLMSYIRSTSRGPHCGQLLLLTMVFDRITNNVKQY